MVTPTSLNGNGCATALVATSVDASHRPAIKVFMQSSQLSRRSGGRVGADAITLPEWAPRRGSHVAAQISSAKPRRTSRCRRPWYRVLVTQLAIGEPEREVAMAMQRDFLLLVTLVAAFATPAFGQTAVPAVAPTQTAAPGAA